MSGRGRKTNSHCERCRIYQQEIKELQTRIFTLETENGLHKTLPVTSGGKKPALTTNEKNNSDIDLSDVVSFPKLCAEELCVKPKRKDDRTSEIKLTNRFLPLTQCDIEEHSEIGPQRRSHNVGNKAQAERKSVPNVKVRDTLLLGDGAISGVSHRRMQTLCCPSSTVPVITGLLSKVLYQGVKRIIIHVGAVDIRKEQSERLKKDFIKLFEEIDKVEVEAFISGPLPNIDGVSLKFSRLFQLNNWLSRECASRGLHYIDNFNTFWKRKDLFMGRGPHLNRGGARELVKNLLHALGHRGQGPEKAVRKDRASVPGTTAQRQQQLPPPTPVNDLDPAAPAPQPPPPKDSAPPALQQPPPSKDSPAPAPQQLPPAKDPAAEPQQQPPDLAPEIPPSDQLWAPPATSTPSEDSLSFSSPPLSPMALPSHFDSLIKSGIKMAPLTPVSLTPHRSSPTPPAPPPHPSPKVPPTRPSSKPPPTRPLRRSPKSRPAPTPPGPSPKLPSTQPLLRASRRAIPRS
uniref:OSK domain-containing protein n=1 Tax=Oryzias latipes TaxID=8090 RepID=A0A3B3HGL5_ORYLA